jgi:ATP-dependent Clp protease adaptor protein ClpS
MDTHIIETTQIQTEKPKLKKPPMYVVIMLNDDYTPMDFVVDLLRDYFRKSEDEATQIMMRIHQEGQAICGCYPRDIAESKVMQVEGHCVAHGHPLKCRIETESGDNEDT